MSEPPVKPVPLAVRRPRSAVTLLMCSYQPDHEYGENPDDCVECRKVAEEYWRREADPKRVVARETSPGTK